MALVKCPDCGHDVSTAASACPNCGRPMAAMAAPTPQTAPPVKEETLWHGTPSWLLLFGKVVLAFVVAIVLILIYYFGYQFLAPYGTIVWIVIAAIVVWQIVAVIIALARIRTTLYTVTNQRVIIETGLTTKSVEDIDLRYIDDSQFHQTFIERVLGIGNVTIISSDKTLPTYAMRGIRDPRGVRELIRANAYQVSQRQLFTRAT
ncbi:MAG TPA: PH domain-containing protein [Thermoanaerobaculia bacterium]|nr:PH domain-containing protein [Thermoanaerobaculia bacterium]